LITVGIRVNYADFPMLTIYRRHLKNCEHRGEGRNIADVGAHSGRMAFWVGEKFARH
jgi:ubiquinone/menaquinone biosynthesis C-methylase UbiE